MFYLVISLLVRHFFSFFFDICHQMFLRIKRNTRAGKRQGRQGVKVSLASYRAANEMTMMGEELAVIISAIDLLDGPKSENLNRHILARFST